MEDRLLKLLDNSRSDYFNFPVSSIIVTKDGNEYYGVNVETSSPQAGICAERNALYNAVTNGVKRDDIKEIHVMSRNGVYPCFICRAALIDYCNLDTLIVVHDINGNTKECILEDLCTYSFSSEDLK